MTTSWCGPPSASGSTRATNSRCRNAPGAMNQMSRARCRHRCCPGPDRCPGRTGRRQWSSSYGASCGWLHLVGVGGGSGVKVTSPGPSGSAGSATLSSCSGRPVAVSSHLADRSGRDAAPVGPNHGSSVASPPHLDPGRPRLGTEGVDDDPAGAGRVPSCSVTTTSVSPAGLSQLMVTRAVGTGGDAVPGPRKAGSPAGKSAVNDQPGRGTHRAQLRARDQLADHQAAADRSGDIGRRRPGPVGGPVVLALLGCGVAAGDLALRLAR